MATPEVNGKDLLNAVRQMAAEEFDAFLAKALSVRKEPSATTLSHEETQLIRRINRGLPAQFCKRYAQLAARRKRGSLSGAEHQELLKLTGEAERRDAERAAALVKLAKLRRVPLHVLMKKMGIEARPIHG